MIPKKTTIREALALGAKRLKKAALSDPHIEAAYLLAEALGAKRHELFLNSGKLLSASQEERYMDFIERRSRREPAQYIAGHTEFMGFEFRLTRATLIPRPETELLVEEAVKRASSERRKDAGELIIIDLCTGSGCIAISAARLIPGAKVYATDISAEALEAAKENAKINGVADKIRFFRGSLFEPLEGLGLKGVTHMILSNPPYVADGEIEKLQPEIREYEPMKALFGGKDGLDFYKQIIPEARHYLIKGGLILLEMGYDQANAIKRLLKENGGYGDIRTIKDLSGIERVSTAERK